MKTENLKEGLSFDDVLILPRYSEYTPDEVNIDTVLGKKIKLKTPILSAAMDTVSTSKMGIALGEQGGISVIYKNRIIDNQVKEVKKVKKKGLQIMAAVGTAKDTMDRVERLVKADVDGIIIDTAHGHSMNVIKAAEMIKKEFPVFVVAGNIGTKDGAKSLIDVGVDCLKVGLGPGSICTTRIMSGMGVPQITAIDNVAQIARPQNISVIGDGGVKNSGDLAKAIVAGANAVMLGSLLAGTDESPGEIVRIDGRIMKYYRGMGSKAAMQEGSADRYFQKNNASKFAEEGIEAYVSYKGHVKDVINQMIGGLRASLGYMGCKDLLEAYKYGQFIKITQNGMMESKPHSVLHKASTE